MDSSHGLYQASEQDPQDENSSVNGLPPHALASNHIPVVYDFNNILTPFNYLEEHARDPYAESLYQQDSDSLSSFNGAGSDMDSVIEASQYSGRSDLGDERGGIDYDDSDSHLSGGSGSEGDLASLFGGSDADEGGEMATVFEKTDFEQDEPGLHSLNSENGEINSQEGLDIPMMNDGHATPVFHNEREFTSSPGTLRRQRNSLASTGTLYNDPTNDIFAEGVRAQPMNQQSGYQLERPFLSFSPYPIMPQTYQLNVPKLIAPMGLYNFGARPDMASPTNLGHSNMGSLSSPDRFNAASRSPMPMFRSQQQAYAGSPLQSSRENNRMAAVHTRMNNNVRAVSFNQKISPRPQNFTVTLPPTIIRAEVSRSKRDHPSTGFSATNLEQEIAQNEHLRGQIAAMDALIEKDSALKGRILLNEDRYRVLAKRARTIDRAKGIRNEIQYYEAGGFHEENTDSGSQMPVARHSAEDYASDYSPDGFDNDGVYDATGADVGEGVSSGAWMSGARQSVYAQGAENHYSGYSANEFEDEEMAGDSSTDAGEGVGFDQGQENEIPTPFTKRKKVIVARERAAQMEMEEKLDRCVKEFEALQTRMKRNELRIEWCERELVLRDEWERVSGVPWGKRAGASKTGKETNTPTKRGARVVPGASESARKRTKH